ncbi:hypothetical protein EDB92DRAFT_1164251 [Lactarius akahatsu]|uniref:AMP-binding enzyme C-terminal domain-containing protein n=1 Tax=Lactarius akahatsu TaxID=416441 RepID=A0AAD4LNF4_9AGAM|nr:hypothetical protein EDB92DRAFT_1164251 [Lactarius akahatsu]
MIQNWRRSTLVPSFLRPRGRHIYPPSFARPSNGRQTTLRNLLKVLYIVLSAAPFSHSLNRIRDVRTPICSPAPGMFGGRIEEIRGMTGILLPYMEARLLREDGSDADYDEVGELLLRAPTVALGYLNNEKATKETFVDGWLHTGDRFYVDKQERFFYVDRIKDILKVSGKQVSPTEIEDTILEHPSQLITDVAVAGIKGTRLPDELVPRAWVVLSTLGKQQGAEAVFAALEEWTRSRLSKHKWLRGGLQIVDEIPRSPIGKVLRRKLQDDYARREPEGVRAKAQTKL